MSLIESSVYEFYISGPAVEYAPNDMRTLNSLQASVSIPRAVSMIMQMQVLSNVASCRSHNTAVMHHAQVADMLALPFADGHFDAVVEKATMDVLFVENDSPFDPKQDVKDKVFQMLRETYR